MINFAVLSTESFAVFICAIICTIFSLGLIVFYLRKAEKLNLFWNILIVYLLPAISTFLWLYLILSLYVTSFVTSLVVSLAVALILVVAMVIIERASKTKEEKNN